MTHSACWKAAREFSPLKKVEFSRKVVDEKFSENFSVLPNGAVHGRVITERYHDIYNNAKLVATVYLNGHVVFYHSNNRKYVYDNLIVTHNGNDVTFRNVKTHNCIQALHCLWCKKYHQFFSIYNWSYAGNCLHKGLSPYQRYPERVSKRKATIVRSIIDYAKKLKQ